MSKDIVEEKARAYAGITPDVNNVDQLSNQFVFVKTKYFSFVAGYTQAITDLSPKNAQLREALREATQALTDISDPIEYLKKQMPKDGYKFDLSGAVEFSNNGMSVSGMAKDALSKLLTKAKTLIE